MDLLELDLSDYPNYCSGQTHADARALAMQVKVMLNFANSLGIVVTIGQVPKPGTPLAMGNTEYQVDFRPMRIQAGETE